MTGIKRGGAQKLLLVKGFFGGDIKKVLIKIFIWVATIMILYFTLLGAISD